MLTIKQNELSATEKEVLLKFHKESKQAIQEEIRELTKELEEVEFKIAFYSGAASNDNKIETGTNQIKLPTVNGYDRSLTLPWKALFVLNEINKAVHVTTVFDRLAQYEPDMKKDKKIAKNREAALYSAFANLEGKGKVVRFRDKHGFLRVALSEWCDENKRLKDEYR